MYVWETDSPVYGRVRREHGTWGFAVVMKCDWDGSGERTERLVKNEMGTVLLREEVRMSQSLGSVGASCGMTLNLGKFESARVDVWKTMPCSPEAAEETYRECYEFVSNKVQEVVCSIRKDVKEAIAGS